MCEEASLRILCPVLLPDLECTPEKAQVDTVLWL